MIGFLSQIEILLLNILKLLKILGFSRFFFKFSQIPGFFRFPGKVANPVKISDEKKSSMHIKNIAYTLVLKNHILFLFIWFY